MGIEKHQVIATITFEDKGQDFLEWDVDHESRIVVDCRPFQREYWTGHEVMLPVEPGDQVWLMENEKPVHPIKYPVVSVLTMRVHHHGLVNTSVEDAMLNVKKCCDLTKLQEARAYERINMDRVTLLRALTARIRKVEGL